LAKEPSEPAEDASKIVSVAVLVAVKNMAVDCF
jgi:hypothetical protein